MADTKIEEEKSKEGGPTPDMANYFRNGMFFILMILLFISTIHFYFSVTDAVSRLFEYRYKSLVTAGFSASVIAVVVYLLRYMMLKKGT